MKKPGGCWRSSTGRAKLCLTWQIPKNLRPAALGLALLIRLSLIEGVKARKSAASLGGSSGADGSRATFGSALDPVLLAGLLAGMA
jgi:hypothetical protein